MMKFKHLCMILMYLSEGVAACFLFGMIFQQSLIDVLKLGFIGLIATIISLYFHLLEYLEARDEEVDKR